MVSSAKRKSESLLTHLNMPLLAHGVDNTPLYWSPTSTTDRHTHLVMARQTEQLSLQFPGVSRQFLTVDRETVTVIPYGRKDGKHHGSTL